MPLKMKDSEIMQCVQVKVEIGHRARPRAKPTKEGFTHDWTVYVRAPEGSNLAHFVEKVEFHLHDTFADPHRVVTKPPYHVSEMGYADFDLPIEIYFKNKGEPQKIKFNYNLFLQTHKSVNYVRCEKLTFVNPTDEFKKKLIKAGGVYVLPPGETQFADFCGSPIKTESVKKQKQPSTISSKVHVLPPGKAQLADLCGPPIKTESLKEQKQPSTISSKVHVLPPGETQFADLFGPPIKTESLKKQKQPSTISSKVLALPPVDAQFADLFGSPIKVTKQKQPSIISSKENVSKQLLNFSGDEKPSSSGKNISASLNSTAKQVKIYNKSKSHDAAYTSSSSSSVSISKEMIQKTQSSKEKPSCKESNNSSKMVPNPSPLPSHKRPSDHPIPSENNQTKIQVKTDKVEKYEHSLSKSTDAKKSKSVQRKRSGSLVSELDSSMAKIQQVSIKHLSKVNPTELKEDLSFPSVNMVKSTCKIDRIYEVKSQRKTDISPTCGISKSSYQIHSRSALKQLMDELDDDSADDDDIIDTVDVFSQPKLAKNSPLVKPVKESSALSCKNNSDKSRKAISEISPTIKNPTISKDSIRKSFTKSVFEKKTESLNFNDTRNKTHHGTQPPTNTPSPVTKSKEGESSEEKSKCKIDSIYEVKSQRKTVRKYVNVKTKSSSSSESRKQDEKHPNSFPIDIPSESDDDFFADITGSDYGVDLDISPNYGTSKTSNQIYSRSDLKQLMDELEDNSADDDDDDITKSSSEGENDQKDKSSNRNVKFEISTDAIKEQINRSRSSVSALNHSVAKEQQNNMEDLSQVTLMELKEDLYISSDSSSESDDDFFLDISGSESDMDLDISPTWNISKTSNHIYSKSALKMLMHELEDSSADDEDDRKSEITTTKSEQRKRSGSPISTLFGSMAKKQRVSMKHLSNDSLMELKEDLSRSR